MNFHIIFEMVEKWSNAFCGYLELAVRKCGMLLCSVGYVIASVKNPIIGQLLVKSYRIVV